MKKILLISLILASTVAGYAQKTDTLKNLIQKNAEAIGHGGNNELKINLLFTVIGMPEVTYERVLVDNMGVGASLFFGADNSIDYKFGFIPYYRLYFGAKKASGFFIEGNASLITRKDNRNYYAHYDAIYAPGYVPMYKEQNLTNFGLGAAAGAKFLTRNGFLGEIYLGVGKSFGDRDYYNSEAYPRVGITIGKRF